MPDQEDDELDPEGPDESDIGDEDDVTIPCPYCRKPVHEDSDICPNCGSFISAEDAPRSFPWWIWAGLILILLAILTWSL